jgi:hypothetical protein
MCFVPEVAEFCSKHPVLLPITRLGPYAFVEPDCIASTRVAVVPQTLQIESFLVVFVSLSNF